MFRLVLDQRGRASGCTLLESAGNVGIEGDIRGAGPQRPLCYQPARDPNGNAVQSVAVHIRSFGMDMEIRLFPG